MGLHHHHLRGRPGDEDAVGPRSGLNQAPHPGGQFQVIHGSNDRRLIEPPRPPSARLPRRSAARLRYQIGSGGRLDRVRRARRGDDSGEEGVRFGIIAALADFVPVCKATDIPAGTGRVVDADGVEIAVFNTDGVYHALENACASGGSIGEGQLRGYVVTCPLDGEPYDVRTGISPVSDAIFVRHFDVRVSPRGEVLVRLEPTEDEDEQL